nr:hypothetical protein [Tanacetum cinerariifolium]
MERYNGDDVVVKAWIQGEIKIWCKVQGAARLAIQLPSWPSSHPAG